MQTFRGNRNFVFLFLAAACSIGVAGFLWANSSRGHLQSHPPSQSPTNLKSDLESKAAADSKRDSIQKGRKLILNYRFLPRDFHQSTFDDLWQDWPEPLKSRAKKSTPDERRKLAFTRYGFTARQDEPQKPMQYVVDSKGWWAMNCFTCHGGKINGGMVEGLPNSHISLETLYADVRKTKLRRGESFSQMDLGSMVVPMGTSDGTSNAVIFGIGLMSFRDKDLNIRPKLIPRWVVHHDMDAPAWWHVSKRDRLYIDGFVKKNHRALVPFVMDQMNSGEKMRNWEDEFKLVFAYIESLEPPDYPFEIDHELAKKGNVIFNADCASCHGTYGARESYPSKIIPIEKIKTDSTRLTALTKYDRRIYGESWFANYGKDETVLSPTGYQAPPLDGIWASGPYFHNGSVPTLVGVLDSESRPKVWKRTEHGFDQQRVGLEIEQFDEMPAQIKRADQKRKYFVTTKRGKGNQGHTFGDKLTDAERIAVIEYLKSL